MIRRLWLSAPMLAVALATPAAAQPETSGTVAVPSALQVPALIPDADSRPQPQQPPISADGSSVYPARLIGRWGIVEDIEVGLGLLTVTRTSPKERALRRAQPMQDVRGRDDRLAAIGISFSF